MGEGDRKTDLGELKEILDTVSEKVPRMIRELMGSLYSKEAGTSMGQSIGAFYRELVDSGIPEKDALDMAKSYIFSLKDVMRGEGGRAKGGWNFNMGGHTRDEEL